MKKYMSHLWDETFSFRLIVALVTLVSLTVFLYVPVEGYAYAQAFIFGIFALVSVIFTFSFKLKRATYEFEILKPFSKKDIFLGRYLIGYFNVLLPYVIVMGINGFYLCFYCAGRQGPDNFILPYVYNTINSLVIALVGGLFYSYFAVLYTRANNIIDAIINIILGTFGPMLIGNFIILIIYKANNFYIDNAFYYFNPFSVLEYIGFRIIPSIYYSYDRGDRILNMMKALENHVNYAGIDSLNIYIEQAVSYYLMLVIMGLSIAYFVYKSYHVKVEDINQKSNDIVGYRTLIPLTFIGLSAFINVGVTNFYYIFGPLAIILTYLSFALYQRSFKLRFRYWIEVSIYVLIEIALFVTLLVIGI